MDKRKFWPLDFDPEGEIYDNVAWDLPGYRNQTFRPIRRPKYSQNEPVSGFHRKHATW